MRDRLLIPSPCTQGEGWVGGDRYGVGRGFDLAEPLAKNPHLGPCILIFVLLPPRVSGD